MIQSLALARPRFPLPSISLWASLSPFTQQQIEAQRGVGTCPGGCKVRAWQQWDRNTGWSVVKVVPALHALAGLTLVVRWDLYL